MLKLLEKAEGKELQDQLLPSVSLRPMSFNALVAPNEMFASALNRNLNMQRFQVLYICGNYSSVLSRLDRKFVDLEIRRAFTVFQLMTILEEASYSLIIIEHDPLLYENTGRWSSTSPKVCMMLQKRPQSSGSSPQRPRAWRGRTPRRSALQSPARRAWDLPLAWAQVV